ncbi:MAG: alpha/beta hydrolase family esterase, partial [Burkholderiales bacterium]
MSPHCIRGVVLAAGLMVMAFAAIDPARADLTGAATTSYSVETRTIVSGGVTRSFVLAHPTSMPDSVALPLVFSLHGDGGTGMSMRAALPLEAQATDGAVFIYPDAPGGSFEYWSDDGRSRETVFVTDVISAMQAEFGVDTRRVYIAGFSGGATMANALGCRLGDGVIRGLGINSGSLYPVNGDFDYTADGGVTCALPSAIIAWGMD